MEEFLNQYENPSKAVDVMLCTKLQETMDRNQSVIESLLKQKLAILAKHLAESPKNACYTSKGIQNELM